MRRANPLKGGSVACRGGMLCVHHGVMTGHMRHNLTGVGEDKVPPRPRSIIIMGGTK